MSARPATHERAAAAPCRVRATTRSQNGPPTANSRVVAARQLRRLVDELVDNAPQRVAPDRQRVAFRREPLGCSPTTGVRVRATTLAAARAVGWAGGVLGVDVSEPMLSVARQRVADAALSTSPSFQADAQTHPFVDRDVDIAMSRFGTMFFDEPTAAFTNVANALRPGGRLCIATWQPLIANQWLTVPGGALLRYGSLPESNGLRPGMFAQSDPETIDAVLTGSGFVDIDIRPVAVPLHLGADVDRATAHLADTGVGRAVLATIPDDQHPAALDAVRGALVDYLDDDSVHLGGAILLTTATRC